MNNNNNDRPDEEVYIDVAGVKTGPYTKDQITGLLEDNEILPDSKITSESLNGKWVSVRDFLDNQSTIKKVEKNATNFGFQPPPRPVDLDKRSEDSEEQLLEQGTDPALSLFDTLQAAKERKAAKLSPPVKGDWGKPTSLRRKIKIPKQAWFIAGTALILVSAIFGMTKIIQTLSNRNASKETVKKETTVPVKATISLPNPVPTPRALPTRNNFPIINSEKTSPSKVERIRRNERTNFGHTRKQDTRADIREDEDREQPEPATIQDERDYYEQTPESEQTVDPTNPTNPNQPYPQGVHHQTQPGPDGHAAEPRNMDSDEFPEER